MFWRAYFDSEYLSAWELGDGDQAVIIEKVTQGELRSKGSKTGERKPFLHFVGHKKPLVLNTTNAKSIVAMYGTDTDDWAGRPIAIYATRTMFGDEEVDCIRVRPTPPKASPPPDLVEQLQRQLDEAKRAIPAMPSETPKKRKKAPRA